MLARARTPVTRRLLDVKRQRSNSDWKDFGRTTVPYDPALCDHDLVLIKLVLDCNRDRAPSVHLCLLADFYSRPNSEVRFLDSFWWHGQKILLLLLASL